MRSRPPLATKAFGVEPGVEPYRLRQARYYEIGCEAAAWATEHARQTGNRLELLDVGPYDGVLRRYVESSNRAAPINWHGVDFFPHGEQFVYKHADWTLHNRNLEGGMPDLQDSRYDLVVCEQVLEHLHNPERALADMYRVLRPGGRLVLGVPIFPPGIHLVRKHVVPVLDRWTGKQRGHVQGWSLNSFKRMVEGACPGIRVEHSRGFRILSGGVLRPLEYRRWWWRLNRRIGRKLAALCTEVQLVASKQQGPHPHSSAAQDAA